MSVWTGDCRLMDGVASYTIQTTNMQNKMNGKKTVDWYKADKTNLKVDFSDKNKHEHIKMGD